MSIFYKITTSTGEISYLFGTIQQNDTEFVTLPLEVKRAFEQSTDFLFETDLNSLKENSMSIFSLDENWTVSVWADS